MIRIATIWSLLVWAALSSACGPPNSPPAGSMELLGRDVILITIDTLRADHLGCYGYSKPTSPNIDRLAMDGALFERVVSSSAFTGPSIASILTGKYPRFNSFGYHNRGAHLVDDETTLAEHLAADGYRTAAFICNPVIRRQTGLDQGFELYDEQMDRRETIRNTRERLAPDATRAAIAWLDGLEADQRVFLWMHYQDPHGPYTPPEEDAARFRPSDPGERIPAPADSDHSGHGAIPEYQAIGEVHYFNEYVARYDGEIAYVDREVGRLFDRLRELGRYDRALVLLTSDHAEALGEYGYYFAHGHSVTRDQSLVPLILKHPALEAGTKISVPVGHIDIVPTLSAVTESPFDLTHVWRGQDLARIAESPTEPRALFCDVGDQLAVHLGDHLLVGMLRSAVLRGRGPDAIAALTPADFKPMLLTTYASPNAPRIIDRARLAKLRRQAAAYLSTPASSVDTQPVDAETEEDLRKLGYAH